MPPIRPALKYALYGTFAVTLTVSYLTRYPLPLLGSSLISLGWAFLALLCAWGIGLPLARKMLPSQCTRGERLVFGVALGWGAIALLMMGLGTVGLWTVGVARGGVLVGAVVGLFFIFKNNPFKGDMKWEISGWTWAVVLLIAALALSPITYYDSLVYHFALPAAYVKTGHWKGWTELVYSAFPQNLEMLWTLGLLLHKDIVSNAIGASLAVFLILAVSAWGTRFIDRESTRAATTLLSVMPAFILLSSGGYVDIGLALYVFLSLYALSLWWPTRKRSLLIGAGVLAGVAMGIKYTGGLAIGIGVLLITYHGMKRATERRRIPASLAIFVGSALLVFLPWAIKNWHYYGNPVFPFLYQWGEISRNPWPTAAAEGYFQGLTEYTPRHIWQLPELAWQIVTRGLDFGGGMDVLETTDGPRFLYCFLRPHWQKLGSGRYAFSRLTLVCFLPCGA